jgi:hypothetical protein
MKAGTILLLFVALGALLFLAQYFVKQDLADAGQRAQQAAGAVGTGVSLKNLLGI